MDIFGIKRRKEEKEKANQLMLAEQEKKVAEQRRQKEAEAKMQIRKTLRAMQLSLANYENMKNKMIEQAKKAVLMSSKQAYENARTRLKVCIHKQRALESMYNNFEMMLQEKEMDGLICDFVAGVNTIVDQMSSLGASVDIAKAQLGYQKIMASTQDQFENMYEFMKDAEQNLEESTKSCDDVSDAEIDKLINMQAVNQDSEIDDEIEKQLQNLRQQQIQI